MARGQGESLRKDGTASVDYEGYRSFARKESATSSIN